MNDTDPIDKRGVAFLEVRRPLRIAPAALCDALSDPAWLGRLVDPPPERPDAVRIETDLALRLHADSRVVDFRKAAFVDIGPVRRERNGCTAEIAWRAASLAPLFPVFAGHVVADRSAIRLTGAYTPPGGGIGLLIDRALLHYFAERTGSWFLDRLAARLEAGTADPTAELSDPR